MSSALEAIAAEAGKPIDEVRRSWRNEVRQPWLEAGFFIERAGI